jgi:antitoxin component YwqK of YwqJK toxin-antitoxin module
MKLKAILFAAQILFVVTNSMAQLSSYIYYFDENLGNTSKEKAVIIGKGFNDHNNFRLECYLNTTNELLLVASFTDSSLSVFNGDYILYQENNKIKEQGSYKYDKKQDIWKVYDKSGKIVDSIIYENGVRMRYAKYYYYYNTYVDNGIIKTDSSQYSIGYDFTDSLKNEFTSENYSIKNGRKSIKKEVFFIGQKGVVKSYDSLQNVTIDTVFTRKENEASYYNGDSGWREFLTKNLKGDVGVNNGAPPGYYQTVVKFIVEVDGTINDVTLENDPGFGMGKEALRVIKLVKKWKPAMQYGRLVRAYRRQPITFQISVQ